MKRYILTLMLEEDIVLTARSATAGVHETLDYIPGSALYGACAAKIYHTLKHEQAFEVFHSGQVRLGNGLPLSPKDELAYPMPFAWHVQKGDDYWHPEHRHWLNHKQIINALLEQAKKNIQLQQLRKGYITHSGQILKPATTFRMKTAIDPNTATAAEAQLFGYAALEAGQRFQSWLEIDDIIPEAIREQICTSLTGSIRLGRSRSAQYGTVICQLDEQDEPNKTTAPVVNDDNNDDSRLVLWLVSDLALRDARGLPTLEPEVMQLGLPHSHIDWDKTYLRFRHYSPYNAARKHYDQERQVIQQGSVISLILDANQPLTDAQRLKLQTGIGDYQHNGLGRVLVNPALLVEPLPAPIFTQPVADPPAPEPKHPLVQWLKSQTDGSSQRSKTRVTAETLAAELQQLYDSARAFAAQPEGVCVGPGKTQWGRITTVGKQGNDRQTLLIKLRDIVQFNEQQGKIEDEDWAMATGLSGAQASFGGWLLHTFETQMNRPGDVAALLGRLADERIRTLESRSTRATQESDQ